MNFYEYDPDYLPNIVVQGVKKAKEVNCLELGICPDGITWQPHGAESKTHLAIKIGPHDRKVRNIILARATAITAEKKAARDQNSNTVREHNL